MAHSLASQNAFEEASTQTIPERETKKEPTIGDGVNELHLDHSRKLICDWSKFNEHGYETSAIASCWR